MELLKDYFKARQRVYNYFGYNAKWHVSPIEDNIEFWWFLYRETIIMTTGDNKEQAVEKIKNEKYYKAHCIDKYRKDDYTMLEVETQSDGNIFLSVFDNSKELGDGDVKEYLDYF